MRWKGTWIHACFRTYLNSSSKFVSISSPVEKTLNRKIQLCPRICFWTACHRHKSMNKLLAPQLQVFSQIEDDLSTVVRRSLAPTEEKDHPTQHPIKLIMDKWGSPPSPVKKVTQHRTKLHIQRAPRLAHPFRQKKFNNQFQLHQKSRTIKSKFRNIHSWWNKSMRRI